MNKPAHTYPSSYPKGKHWAIDKAWEILDQLPVDLLTGEQRAFIGGQIAGALMRAHEQPQAGPTGDFPRGKLDGTDEGGLNIEMGLTPDGSTFMLRFGKQVSWIGMSKQEAFDFAKAIMAKVVDRHVTLEIPD